MGGTNSIPVVSQIKSLVQYIGGDETGAQKTQDEFVRTGLVASQINSLAQSINGNNDEALKIQQEAGDEYLKFLESTPGIGHGISAGYAAAGDLEKAEDVAIGATKSTVIAMAAVGCGLATAGSAAAPCAAVAATGLNFAWDGVESAITGENKGTIRGVTNLVNGKGSLDENFDFIAGTVLTAGGAALGARGVRCSRSIQGEVDIFDHGLRPVPLPYLQALPASFDDFDQSFEISKGHTVDPINAIFQIFLILKLMKIGHPKSKPYFIEICQKVYPQTHLDSCHQMIYQALNTYEKTASDNVQMDQAVVNNTKNGKAFPGLIDNLNVLVFQMENMIRRTSLGNGIDNFICHKLGASSNTVIECSEYLFNALSKAKRWSDYLDREVILSKRSKRCVSSVAKGIKNSKGKSIKTNNPVPPSKSVPLKKTVGQLEYEANMAAYTPKDVRILHGKNTRRIENVVKQKLGGKAKIVKVGSRSKATHIASSDVDFRINVPYSVTLKDQSRIANGLIEEFGRKNAIAHGPKNSNPNHMVHVMKGRPGHIDLNTRNALIGKINRPFSTNNVGRHAVRNLKSLHKDVAGVKIEKLVLNTQKKNNGIPLDKLINAVDEQLRIIKPLKNVGKKTKNSVGLFATRNWTPEEDGNESDEKFLSNRNKRMSKTIGSSQSKTPLQSHIYLTIPFILLSNLK